MNIKFQHLLIFLVFSIFSIKAQSLLVTAAGAYGNNVHGSMLEANSDGFGGHFRLDYVPGYNSIRPFTMYGLRSYHFNIKSSGTSVTEQKNNLVLLTVSPAFNRKGFVVMADLGVGLAFTEKVSSSSSEKRTDMAINLGFTGIAEISSSVGLHTSVGYVRYFDNKLNSGYVLGTVGLLVKLF